MKTFRFWALLTSVVALASGCGSGITPSGEAAVGDRLGTAESPLGSLPVRLIYAQGRNYGCSSCVGIRVAAEVENLAYEKQVALVYSADGGPWQEVKLEYLRSPTAQKDIFITPATIYGMEFQFALRYRAGGREYWDNRGGSDYRLAVELANPTASALLGPGWDLVVTEARDCGGLEHICTQLLVRNRGDAPKVELVYSTDGWTTHRVAQGQSLASADPSGEAAPFSVTLGVSPTGSSVSFAAHASAAGVDVWDNAYQRNFDCVRLASRLYQGWKCTGGAAYDSRFNLPQP